MTPTVLHLTNDRALGPDLGFGRAFGALAAEGRLTHRALAPNELGSADEVLRQAAAAAPDLLFVQSPGIFPWSDADVTRLLRALGHPPVVYWEGDPWGGRKPLSAGMLPWLRHADAVHTVGLGCQARLLGEHTRRPVRYVPNTLPDHLMTDAPVPPITEAEFDVMHIGSCFVRLGFLERIDDARDRLRLVRGLRRLRGTRLAVYGRGWRGRGTLGPLPFDRQITALRDAWLSANWDHFSGRDGYFSNRLPISLYAGRPHVTTRPPSAGWLPGTECGLYLADSPAEAVDQVRELLCADPAELHAAGLAGHAWVRDRLTKECALRHMLGPYLDVAPPPADPWAAIGAMDLRDPVAAMA